MGVRTMSRSSRRLALLLLVCVFVTAFALAGSNTAVAASNAKTYIIALDKDYSARWDDQAAIKLVNQLLEQGVPVRWALQGFQAGDEHYPAGTFFIKTPFTTASGISGSVEMSWLDKQGKNSGIVPVRQTTASIHVTSKPLVLPRIVLFYDQTTYENCLKHYQLFSRMGFKVTLATANDLLVSPDDPSSVLAHSNVFVMPGGALHLWAFPYDQQANAIANIQKFVHGGGGYIGVCAGATEALAQSPYANLSLLDANYHSEWFDYADPAAGDWDWRALIGPMYLHVTAPQNPVMFGYGPNAVRAAYGPDPTMYYWGGPAMWDEGSSVTVLARYLAPAVGQTTSDKVKDIWGSAAVATAGYGSGKVVLFGPHPEWPGPDGKVQDGRMYAQALYYVASQSKASSLEAAGTDLPTSISAERVAAITGTVDQARPLLSDMNEAAATLAALPTGGTYHPLGLWYPETVPVYTQTLAQQMNELSADAVSFQREYGRLQQLKARLGNDPQAMQWITQAQAQIEQFFAFAENLPAEPHVIAQSDWTGDGPFQPYPAEREAKAFPDLLWSFSYVDQELRASDLPVAQAYVPLLAEYDALRSAYLANPTAENKQAMDAKYLEISSSWPAGPMYQGMYTLEHTLDVMQYKIDTHLLNLLTRAQRAKEVLSVNEYALWTKLHNWQPVSF
jgi:glutamine amidotransferase-like uncharacterized protein